MAGEIGHIVYAARLLTHIGDKVSSSSYWTGTLFPDIHRTRSQSRYPTHPRPVRLSTLLGRNDFITGMRVHTWIDDTREQCLREHAAYETLKWHPLLPWALELFEDEMLYEAYPDWDMVERSLSTTHPDELQLVHEHTQVEQWHNILTHYISIPPSDESRLALMHALNISPDTASEANRVVAELKNNPTAKDLIHYYMHDLEHMLA